jgi:8-oxo-dGTP diphosphatase
MFIVIIATLKLLVTANITIKIINNDIRLLFEFVPELFTIGQLEGAYKSIYGIENSVPNFRRSIEKYVIETDMWAEKTSYRPAKLYKKNYEKFL